MPDPGPRQSTSDRFVPAVLEDCYDGTLWIAGNRTKAEAIEEATRYAGGAAYRPIRVWMREGEWGDENEWGECEAGDEGAVGFWRMDVPS